MKIYNTPETSSVDMVDDSKLGCPCLNEKALLVLLDNHKITHIPYDDLIYWELYLERPSTSTFKHNFFCIPIFLLL